MNNLEKLGRMSDQGMDIQLAPLGNITNVEVKGGNGFVTLGITQELALQLALHPEKFVGGFLVADREQFESMEG